MTEADEDAMIFEMKSMLRQKVIFLANCLENSRTNNIEVDVRNAMSMTEQLSLLTGDVGECLHHMEIVENIISKYSKPKENTFSQPKFQTGSVGRPTFVIPEETLEYLLESNFTVPNISKYFNVSQSTIKRRMREYGLSVSQTYSSITDEDLSELVSSIKSEFPDAGYLTISACLKARGHRVQRARVRQFVQLVDADGVLFRKLFFSVCRIQRRTYYVPGPNALWHIDGNHKLIRWRFVIHGGIDGYSRLPVFLNVNTNNKSSSVLDGFKSAVVRWGLPERVRSDKGGENVLVAEYMLINKGKGSFITGRSVHNQRIERFWREVWGGCTCFYYHLFGFMESHNILNIDDEQHMQALHLVYRNKIQSHLDSFKDAIIHRPLRTERFKSPLQLFIEGQRLSNNVNAQDQQQPDDDYGVDYQAAIDEDGNTFEMVNVPQTDNPNIDLLNLALSTENEDDTHGIDTFLKVVEVLKAVV